MAQGRLENSTLACEQAGILLDRLFTAAEKAGWVHEQINILVLQALNANTQGEIESALQRLERAVLLSHPGGYVRIFLDEGETIHKLLTILAKRLMNGQIMPLDYQHLASFKEYVASVLSAFENRPDQLSPKNSVPRPVHPGTSALPMSLLEGQVLNEALSSREIEVLKLVAQGHTDKKNAQILVIAPETVHKHLKNIYGKLGVHSRTQAVAYALKVNLL